MKTTVTVIHSDLYHLLARLTIHRYNTSINRISVTRYRYLSSNRDFFPSFFFAFIIITSVFLINIELFSFAV
jgi:hypothetical protein